MAKKSILFLAIVLGSMVVMAGLAAAQPKVNDLTAGVGKQAGFDTTGVTDTTLSQTVGGIIKVALSVTGTLFLALTVYAGILWMTAAGNDERVDKAMKILRASLIGLIVVVASYSLTYFVVDIMFSVNAPSNKVGG